MQTKSDCYGVVSVSGKSKTGGASDAEADAALTELGFRQASGTNSISADARPSQGERFVLEANMMNAQAGNFCLYRAMNSAWQIAHTGRINSRSDSSIGGIVRFELVSATFSKLTILCGIDAIARTIDKVPYFDPKAMLQNQVISINAKGEEVYGEDVVIVAHPDLIMRFVDQPRKIFVREKILALGQNILEYGQHRPGVAMLIPEEERVGGEMYALIGGERRLEGIRSVWYLLEARGIKGMKIIVRKKMDVVDQYTAAYIDNKFQEPPSTFEDVLSIHWLFDKFKDIAEVHRRSGEKVVTIRQYLRLRELDPWVFEQMSPEVPEERRLRITHAKELLDVKDHAIQRSIYRETYIEGGGGIHSIGRKLKMLAAAKKTEVPKRKKNLRKAVARGVQSIIFGTLRVGEHMHAFESHVLFMKPADAKELTASLRKAGEKIGELLKIAEQRTEA